MRSARPKEFTFDQAALSWGMPRGNSKTDMRFFESFRRFQARDSGMQCTAAMARSSQGTFARDGNDLAMKQAYVYAGVHQGKE